MSIGITLFSMMLTISVYILSLWVFKKRPSIFTMPILFCTIVIIAVFVIGGISYEEYHLAKEIMTYLLGPATVALAVPLYKQRKMIKKNMLPIMVGMMLGTIVTIGSAVAMAIWFGLSDVMIRSLSVKSITIPIADEVAYILDANPTLVAGFVMITGMFGAMFGSVLLNIAKITHPVARGLSFGTMAHGIGTAQAMNEGEIQGATSGIAIGLAGIFTS
ncbi:MAG TPA: LrgB family protein, partial [Virgibacillus sp.]|nr:LrgB family protein [Virgibacillus sp.]